MTTTSPSPKPPSPSIADGLQGRIKDKTALVGVIGLGYVGLPLVRELTGSGYPVLGFDIDPRKVEQLNGGTSYIGHIPDEMIADLVAGQRFEATADFGRLAEPDAILICVPTPLDDHRQPDMSYIEATGRSIGAALRPGQLVVLESTTYPGTTEEVLQPLLDAAGLELDRDYFLAYSPEREDPGNPRFTTRRIPKVVGGAGPASGRLASALYGGVVEEVVTVSGTREAEASKILENVYRCVNIALVNELKVLFDAMGIDVWEVIAASKTKPFGFQAFYPGPGLGGHCIPVDPFYLSWKAQQYEVPTRFIRLAGEINTGMPQYVVARLTEALNDDGKALRGARVLMLGVAYKKNVDDVRESPALKLIELLEARGAALSYHDPHVADLGEMHGYTHIQMQSVPLDDRALATADAVLVVTDHDAVDYQRVLDRAGLVVDTRNATGGLTGSARVVRA